MWHASVQAQGRAGERLQHRAGAELRHAVDALQHHHLMVHLASHGLVEINGLRVVWVLRTWMALTFKWLRGYLHVATLRTPQSQVHTKRVPVPCIR